MDPALLLVISGPSGVGKGTVCHALKKLDPTIHLSVSATTRAPREGEQEGIDYYFVSEARFQELLQRGELLEWARVYDYYYGTPKKAVDEARATGKDVILEIDVQGGLKVRENCPDSVLIFILPPSLQELSERLKRRGTENEESINLRLRWAQSELPFYRLYDYVIVNRNVEECVAKINAIRIAEKCRARYQQPEWIVL
ncbi:MAG: guanylate kinase [Firmicutes bacterium]|nr:guanylate kinase [Bacillota bacterium]